MEDDELGLAGDCDPGGVVEHADRHPLLLVALHVAEEGRDRRVHRQDDARVARDLAEPLRPGVVHPEPALEVDLARRVASCDEILDGLLRALARRDVRRPEADRSHGASLTATAQGLSDAVSTLFACRSARRGSTSSSWTST